MQLRPTVNGKRRAQETFRHTPDQKGLFGLLLTKTVFSVQVRTFSAKARPKSPFRPKGDRKHPFRPTRGRRGASFDFSPLFAIVSEFAIKCVIVLKKKFLASAPARASNRAQCMHVLPCRDHHHAHSVELAVSRDKRPCSTTTTIT